MSKENLQFQMKTNLNNYQVILNKVLNSVKITFSNQNHYKVIAWMKHL
jgi:hypothetical protein